MMASDLFLAINKIDRLPVDERTHLIHKMHKKIDNVYKIVIDLEKDKHFKELGELFRKALES